MKAPVATRKPVTHRHFGTSLTDDYAWLRDPNWQRVMTQPDVLQADIRAYLDAENQYTEQQMATAKDLQESLYLEMKGRIKEEDASVPLPDGKYAYFSQYLPGQQYASYWRQNKQGKELLLDANLLAQSTDYFDIGCCEHSPNHKYLAYSIDVHGSEYYEIHVIDIESGQPLIGPVGNAQGNFVWSSDSCMIFYTSLDENHRPDKVMRKNIGDHFMPPECVYTEPDDGFFVGLGITESRQFIIIHAHDHITSEIHLINAHQPSLPVQTVAQRETGLEYSISHHADRLFILTNADGQEDYKIMCCPLDDCDKPTWRDYYVPPPGVLLESLLVFDHYLVRLERIDGLPRITIEHLASQQSSVIAFDEEAYELELIAGYEFSSELLRFSYTSMTTPTEIFDYNMRTGERLLRKRQQIPSGHNPADYITRRLQAVAEDGEQIPISLLYHRDYPPDDDNPLLLYGYGAYGISIPAAFSTARLSLVKRGFTFAIAHVRGGMEKGYRWYRKGKLEHKQNTFTDFIACAEYLIRQQYTHAGHIAIHGGSAGGMLIAAVLNKRPELFRCAVADVPFVDVLNTICDETLPLTPAEWPEWGNPIRSEQDFKTIAGYSPYENVIAQDYPHLLVTAGLTDPRVTYWEPAKWVARLRSQKTDQNTLLLKTNMSAGHAGASGRFEHLHEVAFMYAFILKAFGMDST